MNTDQKNLPVAVIGAGPVGLAAAAQLIERGERVVILEGGSAVGHSVRKWGHVRMFSPWSYNIDAAARRLLEISGWDEPCGKELPTGRDIVEKYLEPLASIDAVASSLRLSHCVISVTREGLDKVRSHGRAERPFVIRTLDAAAKLTSYRAKAVIDASGTWETPNPLGADGLCVPGEDRVSSHIDYGIPDIAGSRRGDFAGAHTLVVGSGHSSFNAILDLLRLKETQPETTVSWAMRKAKLGNTFGGGSADALPERGELGQKVRAAVESGAVNLLNPMAIDRLSQATVDGKIMVDAIVAGSSLALEVDRIVVTTGFRPNLEFSREIRLRIDPALECAEKLGPLIDPNEHSCGSVRPHGAAELAHPDPGYYIVGMKSYGRAPTFLLATGYEQVRSVVAEISGDHEAAARVELKLPETGVCSLSEPVEVAKESRCGETELATLPVVPAVEPGSRCCG
ncbi:FAD-dependent oxidoreductase [Haloferula chungangensis]|uniref:FAD-dependent oxidoreductase n=1 Tax=Haloferula chungangensis TaxID=1048331 RepID=A0ABW2LB53_9BACT